MLGPRGVLMVAYDFPPCTAPGSAVRIEKLAQHLPAYGWKVSVLCRDEGAAADLGTVPSGTDVHRVSTPVPARLSYQLGAWVWAARILSRGRTLIRKTRPAVIYASGPPFPHMLSVARLAGEAGIPLAIDLRDAWSLDPYAHGGRLQQALKRGLCRTVYPFLEDSALRSARAIVVTTPSTRAAYARAYPQLDGRLHLIPNGFEAEEFDEPVGRSRGTPLRLLHCGRLRGLGGRSPDTLLRGIRAVIDAGRAVELEILGDDSEQLRGAIQRAGLGEWVRARPAVARSAAVRAMRTADILVLCQGRGRGPVTAVAGKTYEYLRAGRPILALTPPGDNADLIRTHAPTHVIVSSDDPALIAAGIHELAESAADESAPSDPEFLARYSRRRIARDVADLLHAVIGGPIPKA